MKTLVNFVESVKGCQFGNIEYISEGGIPKKVISGVVTKLVKAQIQFNYNYANAVNNRLANSGCEANFEADKLPWGEWLIPNKVITHKDSLYIRYYDYEWAKVESLWFVDGKPATSEQMDILHTVPFSLHCQQLKYHIVLGLFLSSVLLSSVL